MDGILNINKATGMTSHDVVARVRKLLQQKRVGHAGTLDPLASGVLPICVGQGTRVAEYLSEEGKAYRAEIVFGVVTDTYDAEGTIIRTADTSTLTRSQIEAVLPHFTGPQMQIPPRYSALKIQGKPAYKLARSGADVELAARSITIDGLELLDWQPPRLTLVIDCSKGTYIRSLAFDLGERLGCGAYLASLVRLRSGPYTLETSITLEDLAEAANQHTIARHILPADSALLHYPSLTLPPSTLERVLHGNAFTMPADGEHPGSPEHPPQPPQPHPALARIYSEDGHFVAIATWNTERHLWQPKKVLHAAL